MTPHHSYPATTSFRGEETQTNLFIRIH